MGSFTCVVSTVNVHLCVCGSKERLCEWEALPVLFPQ